MKKIISIFLTLVLAGTFVFAQNNNQNRHGDWRERVRAEQVAFITNELDLSESEAQAFWPVYNDVQKQRREAFKATGEAYMNLQKGVDDKDVDKLLDKYLAAKKASEKVEADAVARYKKVLPVSKVAKLLMAEEKFRQNQIHRLGQGRGPGFPGQQPQTNAPSTK